MIDILFLEWIDIVVILGIDLTFVLILMVIILVILIQNHILLNYLIHLQIDYFLANLNFRLDLKIKLLEFNYYFLLLKLSQNLYSLMMC